MRIKTTAWVMLGAMVVLYGLTGVCVYLLNTGIRQEGLSLQRAAEYKQLGQDLADGSDFLTHEIQRYVVTGAKIHYDHFWEEVNVTRSRDRVVERLRELDAPPGELFLIETAKQRSDDLIEIEEAAMEAVQAGDFTTARELIFGNEYDSYKKAIMEPIARFQELLSTRAEAEIESDAQRAGLLLVATNVLLAVSAALTLFAMYFVVVKGIVEPIGRMTAVMRELSRGDKKVVVPGLDRGDEIGDMAQAVEIFKRDRIRRAKAEKALMDTNAELQSALEELREMQQQIVLQEKLASLGQLTAGVAHEIKNPLNFINNFSLICKEQVAELSEELAPAKDGMDEGVREEVEEILDDLAVNLDKIVEHGRRADGIVKGMLEHSRDSTGEFAPTDLNALLDEYVNLAYHGMRAQIEGFNVTIHTDYGDGLGDVEMVGQDASRVFLNIVTNAFHALHDKRQADAADFDPGLWLTTRRDGDWADVRIRDNGPGMPQDVLEKVFEPFFTTKPTGQGTGLGLSISYDIIAQQHGGKIEASSQAGEGTEFVIRLPLKQGERTPPQAEPDETRPLAAVRRFAAPGG